MKVIKLLIIKFLLSRKAAFEQTIPHVKKPFERSRMKITLRTIEEWIEKLRK